MLSLLELHKERLAIACDRYYSNAAFGKPRTVSVDAPKMDLKETGQHVGQEQMTTPVGTFTCEHYRVTEQRGPCVYLGGHRGLVPTGG